VVVVEEEGEEEEEEEEAEEGKKERTKGGKKGGGWNVNTMQTPRAPALPQISRKVPRALGETGRSKER
jgi:CO dehydrogenase/acetyl-CoA synthase beta subunit